MYRRTTLTERCPGLLHDGALALSLLPALAAAVASNLDLLNPALSVLGGNPGTVDRDHFTALYLSGPAFVRRVRGV
jgi:hypothetical protein